MNKNSRTIFNQTTIFIRPIDMLCQYIYIAINRQICFILSELISVARQASSP